MAYNGGFSCVGRVHPFCGRHVHARLGLCKAVDGQIRYETNIHEISETFSDISLTTDTADIVFALSNDGKCRVECYEPENAKHSAAVANDTLIIEINEQKSWYDYIGFQFGSPRITVYLPQAEYGALSISESTGRIEEPAQNFL